MNRNNHHSKHDHSPTAIQTNHHWLWASVVFGIGLSACTGAGSQSAATATQASPLVSKSASAARLAAVAHSDAAVTVHTVRSTAFVRPESARWDADNQVWYVSNMGEFLDEAPVPGWISRIDANGHMLEERWIDGLGSPKGMAIFDGILYAADGKGVVAIDISAAAIIETIAVEGATFLNDITAGPDALYVSDSLGQAIYRIEPGQQPQLLAHDPDFSTPNGLVVRDNRVVVASFGPFPTEAGAMQTLAPMATVTIGDGARTPLGALTGKFDGIERDGADYLVTDFRGLFMRVDAQGRPQATIDLRSNHGLQSAADHGFDPISRTVMVPDLLGNRVVYFRLPPKRN